MSSYSTKEVPSLSHSSQSLSFFLLLFSVFHTSQRATWPYKLVKASKKKTKVLSEEGERCSWPPPPEILLAERDKFRWSCTPLWLKERRRFSSHSPTPTERGRPGGRVCFALFSWDGSLSAHCNQHLLASQINEPVTCQWESRKRKKRREGVPQFIKSNTTFSIFIFFYFKKMNSH